MIQKTYDECKNIAGNEEFLVLGVVMYCDKTGSMRLFFVIF